MIWYLGIKIPRCFNVSGMKIFKIYYWVFWVNWWGAALLLRSMMRCIALQLIRTYLLSPLYKHIKHCAPFHHFPLCYIPSLRSGSRVSYVHCRSLWHLLAVLLTSFIQLQMGREKYWVKMLQTLNGCSSLVVSPSLAAAVCVYSWCISIGVW